MKNPNLQQLPTRTEWGKAIRKGFVAEEGNVLVAIDYSQIEMRVAAHLAQCRSMIELFKEGRDIHNETAAAVFGPNFTSAHRYASKTLGFGVLYGLTAHGLNTQMQTEGQSDWTEDRCREFIREYFALRPEVEVWQEATRNFAKENGYVKDIFGRMRWTPEVQSPINRIKSAGERQAVNMPVQSTAQGIIKLAMAKLWKTIPESSWLLQIHDELLWTLEESEVDDFIQSTVDVMESVILLSVPIKAESKVGLNWGEMS
jgi:DNA polymerase-1